MSYKVNFDSLDGMNTSVKNQSNNWMEVLNTTNEKFQVLIDTSNMSGEAATNIKCYIQNVHGILIGLIGQLITLHSTNCRIYKNKYMTEIDTGLHANIEASKLFDFKGRIEATKQTGIDIDDSIAYVLRGIKDIFQVTYSDIGFVAYEHDKVVKYITDLNEQINNHEQTHYDNDFINSEQLLDSLKAFINEQLSANRAYRTTFNVDKLSSSSAIRDLYNASVGVDKEIESKEEMLKEAIANEQQRVADLQKEAEDSRSWIKWVAVGVAVVGSVVLIAVTAGGATPLVCAGVGAAVGVATAASSQFADNYVKNGSLTEGMDWSEFGKQCLIGAVTGAISGYVGATSMGSAIKQPIDKAIGCAASSIVENTAEGLINTGWEVGEAIVAGKPGGEILSVLEENVGEMMKDIVVDGVKDFAGGYVGGCFDASSAKKSFLRNVGENVAETAAESVAEHGTSGLIDIGEAVLDPNSSKTFTTILKEEGHEFAREVVGDVAKGTVEGVVDGSNDIYKSHRKGQNESKILEVIDDTLADTVGNVAESVAGQGVDIAIGERDGLDFNEIWEKDLDGGREILKSAGKSVESQIEASESFKNKMKDKDYDNDGKVEVVTFDKYSVLKEDYDAAREVAGKGAYKDQSVQDILGLPKNTAVSEKNVVKKRVSIEDLKESEYKARKTTNVDRIEIVAKKNKNKK